ncbi:HmuY family protein [Aquimarina spongiae]|uniref:HmuY protein n=1 Tax=Aquimarina spongiae TaxID=570521 RepID=A0A1M6IZS3_9FLAO|nr:HmuY family protein [Aquimarina spongiae]SHJ39907.1 HmuY protein [Aquimarina spongiae]
MKKVILALTIFSFFFVACDSDDDNGSVVEPIQSKQFVNLFAPSTGQPGQEAGPFTKFDFETGEVTTSETDWDIAFRATTIAVNGGVVTGTVDEPVRNGEASATIVNGTFASVTTAEGLTFGQDTDGGFAIPTGSDNGWYNYNFMTNLVTPIPGKVLVFKTRNGNYAKIEILSYYKDQDNTQDSRYYTFNYIYNPNTGDTSFE